MKFPKLLYLLIACSLFVFSSCTEDDDTGPNTGNKTCLPVKVTDEDQVTSITYSNGKIASFSNDEFGSVNVQYHTSGNKADKPAKMPFGTDGSFEYMYDNQGKLTGTMITTPEFQGAGLLAEFEYSGNRISKVTRYLAFPGEDEDDPQLFPFGYTTYQYDSKGNVTLVKEFGDQDSTTPDNTTEYTYDSKPTPTAAFMALFIGLPGMTPPAANNILTEVHKEGNTVDKDLSYTNTYVFNENGYPTKTTRTSQNGEVSVINIDYNCQ
ncbi:hypothetical protein [Rufibacter tibetensis]|nr:hypothetical protein [Rufibacter tibetensis]